jgi:hypothetical protein
VSAPDVAQLGGRLDDHHSPETNGRMAICRRCGAVTDGPAGQHRPNQRQLDRLAAWLEGQSRIAGNLRASTRTDT